MQLIPEKPIAPPAAESVIETYTLDVSGMKCAGCVRTVENTLKSEAGVKNAIVNLVTEVAVVECDPGVDSVALADKLTQAGFPSQSRQSDRLSPDGLTPAERQQQETRQQTRRAIVAISLVVLSAIGHLHQFGWVTIPGLSNIWFHWGLATLALLFPGRSILVDGWRGLRRNAPNMNTLVGLGTVTAYTASLIALLFPQLGWECFFDEPVMLVGFILLGRSLEQGARSRATAALQSLFDLQPTIARLIPANNSANGSTQAATLTPATSAEIPASQVKVGEWLQVLPGEKIPVDGEVIAGQTTINESMLTGEAVPVLKQAGDYVAAGTLNLSGVIVIRATRTGKDTTLAQIINLVETAQTRKAPIQSLADTVAGYFTYGVMTIATLTFSFWYFIGSRVWAEKIQQLGHHAIGASHSLMHHGAMGGGMADMGELPTSPLLLSLKLAIAVLVIACPCALGLATPTAILVGSGIGAERGLLIRGGDVLEKVHQLKTIVFDKTGTLTIGQPAVTDCLPLTDKISANDLLQLAATVESGTQHPLAVAIRQSAQQQELPLLEADQFQTEAGLGVAATINQDRLNQDKLDQDKLDQKRIIVGNAQWLDRAGVSISEAARTQAETLAAAGKSLVYVAVNSELVGLIAAQDTLRPDAQETVDRLQQMGLRVMLLTGDQPAAAQAAATLLGLSAQDVLANVRPDEKAKTIAQLQQQGTVGMVGDGINDAPALAQADVGIALYSGTDVAMESAGIVLMRDRLSDVVESIRLSRATFSKIQQNLFWAFVYNLLGIPIAAGLLLPTLGVALSPATAGAFMAFSSVSVVTNSLLLRRRFH
ncbi:heavy metal translocating P-type ATPase [Leptolyngbya ohadii]|uniref:heavy metal translocating P-type ATPase n=1 Tax=Leptolyngbya ohadii TaxID=1962290 RepID=UPI000B59EDB4|nr:heavy metal translocating P-type ATPase [Leptolyngbya ohadii]